MFRGVRIVVPQYPVSILTSHSVKSIWQDSLFLVVHNCLPSWKVFCPFFTLFLKRTVFSCSYWLVSHKYVIVYYFVLLSCVCYVFYICDKNIVCMCVCMCVYICTCIFFCGQHSVSCFFFFSLKIYYYYYFICVGILLFCMSEYHLCAWCL